MAKLLVEGGWAVKVLTEKPYFAYVPAGKTSFETKRQAWKFARWLSDHVRAKCVAVETERHELAPERKAVKV